MSSERRCGSVMRCAGGGRRARGRKVAVSRYEAREAEAQVVSRPAQDGIFHVDPFIAFGAEARPYSERLYQMSAIRVDVLRVEGHAAQAYGSALRCGHEEGVMRLLPGTIMAVREASPPTASARAHENIARRRNARACVRESAA